ncbi:hypothetical protein JOQ06_008974 [Pogonophryne albipinna]|uniref:Uncharacterized protein n=1 Tax=Pogonophryne albipinna TaxID=1090488 RepID=A0AAD6BPL9_9TELE|nr:hypothetical protein JOQ06_008974 [Pogonophryne albipinna]
MASGPSCPPVGRRLRLKELLLGPLLVLLVSGLEPVLCQKVYTNTWAVHIPGADDPFHVPVTLCRHPSPQ